MAEGQTTLQILIQARDEATSKLKTIAGQAKALSTGFLAAGGIITGALGLAVKAAADAEVQMAKVNAILTSMGKNTPQVADAIQKAADATLKLGFDNEEASVSIAKLYQRTGDLTQATKLNSLAMDLSRAKNISLTDASKAVGMVLSGNTKVLKELGIEVDDTLTPMQMLEQAQKRLAGQAQAFSQTFEGQIQVFKQGFGEIVEQVGSILLPVLTQLLTQLQPILLSIQAWTQAHPELTKNIVIITAVIGVLLTVVGALGLALTPLAAAFAFIASPIGLVVAAIGLALIPVILLLVTHFQTLKEGAITAFYNIGETINALITVVTATLAGWKAWLQLWWKDITGGFKSMVDSIVDFFQPLFDVLEKIVSLAGKAIDKVKSAVGLGSSSSKSKKSSRWFCSFKQFLYCW